jgi:light-harvesting complex I chlorophyll a/b binding protein 1
MMTMVSSSGMRLTTLLSLIVSLLLCNPSLSFRPPLVSDELGCSPTLSLLIKGSQSDKQFYFDPIGIANDDNFSRLREAELKHGRISMFAVAGTIVTPILKEVTDWVPTYPNGVLPVFKSLSPVDIAKVVLFCGVMETVIWVQKDPRDMPGDYGTGWLGVRDKGVHEQQLISELENGRLAMIAVAGQVGAELVTGQPWVDQWVVLFLKDWTKSL